MKLPDFLPRNEKNSHARSMYETLIEAVFFLRMTGTVLKGSCMYAVVKYRYFSSTCRCLAPDGLNLNFKNFMVPFCGWDSLFIYLFILYLKLTCI